MGESEAVLKGLGLFTEATLKMTRCVQNVRRMVHDGSFGLGSGVRAGAQRELDKSFQGTGVRVILATCVPWSSSRPGIVVEYDVAVRQKLPLAIAYEADRIWRRDGVETTLVKCRYGSAITGAAVIDFCVGDDVSLPLAGGNDGRLSGSTAATDLSRYPHRCPCCASPAYVGFSEIDCSKVGCR